MVDECTHSYVWTLATAGNFFFWVFFFYFAEIVACVSHKAQNQIGNFAGAASSPSAAGENVTRKPHSNTKTRESFVDVFFLLEIIWFLLVGWRFDFPKKNERFGGHFTDRRNVVGRK